MDIELRLRDVHAIHDPGAHVTEAVMARVGEQSIAAPAGGSGVIQLAAARARRRRRFVPVTVAVAIAAAAGMLMLGRDPEPAAQIAAVPAPAPSAAVTVPMPDPAAAPEMAPVTAAPAAAAQPDRAIIAAPGGLPLFPPPTFRITGDTVDLALQKAVERHPELVEGPDTDSLYHLLLVMRRDGTVINSVARLAPRSETEAVMAELRSLMPRSDADSELSAISGARWARHLVLPDGRVLRTDVLFELGVVGDNYDPARAADRSSQKVEQLVRARHADLLLPADGAEVNQLTLLLTEDGQIEREKVERVRVAKRPDDVPVPELPRTPADMMKALENLVAASAQRVASTLDIEVERIGQIGNLRVQEGRDAVTDDANGNLVPFGESRVLRVTYAWPRRAGESGPSLQGMGSPARFAQGLQQEMAQQDQRLAAAIVIVERLMPEAFTIPNSASGTPVVALTAKGEVIGAVRLHNGDGQPSARLISQALQQLDPAFARGARSDMETLRNSSGATVRVVFAWLSEEGLLGRSLQ
jgi:hypothetical protein